MSLTVSEKAALDALLAKGDLLGAQNLLAGKTGSPTVDAPTPPEPPAPPPPRTFNEIVLDLFKSAHALLGNSPAMVPLMNELATAVNPPPPEEK